MNTSGVPACAEPLPQRYTAGDIMQVISEYGTARYSEGVNDALNRGQLAVESHSAAKDRFNDLRLMLDAHGVAPTAEAQPQEPVAWGVIGADGKLLLAEKRTLLAYFDNPPRPLVWGDAGVEGRKP